jgi:histidyl-tRNA synthetase
MFCYFYHTLRATGDYDIAGTYGAMIPDADCLCVLAEILDNLPIGSYKVKINHRKLLDAIMEVCGVPTEKIRSICSAIDKLDKEPWSAVREEMKQKGLNETVADRIGLFVQIKGEPFTILNQLKAQLEFQSNVKATEGLNDLQLLFSYLEAFNCLSRFSFDLSLARGLDYYTGVIYEAVLTDTDRMGSIAAGGRYDNLVGMFSSKQVPAVGVSIGIERIFALLEEHERKKSEAAGFGGAIQKNATQVLIVTIGKDLILPKMQICAELWAVGINTEFLYDLNPKVPKQMEYAAKNAIPFIVFIGEDELKNNEVKVKLSATKEEFLVKRAELVARMRDLISKLNRPNLFVYDSMHNISQLNNSNINSGTSSSAAQ